MNVTSTEVTSIHGKLERACARMNALIAEAKAIGITAAVQATPEGEWFVSEFSVNIRNTAPPKPEQSSQDPNG